MRITETTFRGTFFLLTCTLLMTGEVNAQDPEFSRTSSAGIQVTTSGPNFNDALFGLDNSFDPMGNSVSAFGSEFFSGDDINGATSSIFFEGEATASANFGVLKTFGTGVVKNSFYNPELPWYDETTGDIGLNGSVPDLYIAFGQATYSDRFNYFSTTGNITAGTKVNFFYQVDGTLTGDESYFSILVKGDEESDLLLLSSPDDGPVINQTWVTKKFTIGADLALNHSAVMISQFSGFAGNFPDGSEFSGTASFGNTVTLTGMNVFDENDNLISNFSVSTASGTVYAVPEPGSLALLAAGVLWLPLARRRLYALA